VAAVYAVMIETGLNKTDLGKLILTACFVCDLGTVMALGIIFANYNLLLIAFGVPPHWFCSCCRAPCARSSGCSAMGSASPR
jgi:hypothetical protein